MMLRLVGAVVAVGAGCDLDLERMIDQPRLSTYEACAVCPEGTIMMLPPEGTIPRSRELVMPAIGTGRDLARGQDSWVPQVPVPVTREVLARGKDRFDIFCAACHGRLGNGVSQVAENMTLRQPPSLLLPPIAGYPAGRVYATITDGFGLMPSYAADLSIADRWAVVAFVQVLQLSQRAELGSLPPTMQKEAMPWLR
jgi:mono/diheme cytochrome c family protein